MPQYNELKERSGDIELIAYTLRELDPANPVAKGKPVPPFPHAGLLGGVVWSVCRRDAEPA